VAISHLTGVVNQPTSQSDVGQNCMTYSRGKLTNKIEVFIIADWKTISKADDSK